MPNTSYSEYHLLGRCNRQQQDRRVMNVSDISWDRRAVLLMSRLRFLYRGKKLAHLKLSPEWSCSFLSSSAPHIHCVWTRRTMVCESVYSPTREFPTLPSVTVPSFPLTIPQIRRQQSLVSGGSDQRQTLLLLSESIEALHLADRALLSAAKRMGWIGLGVLTYARRDDNVMGRGILSPRYSVGKHPSL